MNEKDLDLTKTAVDWTDKAFRGNGDCAAIARTTGKTCKVVLRDGEDTSFLEGIHIKRTICRRFCRKMQNLKMQKILCCMQAGKQIIRTVIVHQVRQTDIWLRMTMN